MENVQETWENWRAFLKENGGKSHMTNDERAGDGYYAEYPLEAFERQRMPFGDDDYSPDGIHVFVEQLPSSMTPWRRYAGRLKMKFNIEDKAAQIAAFMMYYVADSNPKCRGWFEGYIAKGGFKKAYGHLRHLFWQLYKEEPSHGPDKPHSIEEIMEDHIGDGHSFRALRIKDEFEEEEIAEKPDTKTELFTAYSDKIRRAGIHQISQIGKDLYSASNKRLFHYEHAVMLFDKYRTRKAYLEDNYGVNKKAANA